MSEYVRTLSTQTNARCVQAITARQTAVTVSNASFEAYRTVIKLREQAKFTAADARGFLSMSLQAAESAYAERAQERRDTYTFLKQVEQQLSIARAEESDALLDQDHSLLSAGLLRSSSTTFTGGPLGDFRKAVAKTFAAYETMQTFPAPPPLPPGINHSLSCKDAKDERRCMEACYCAVQRAFHGEGINLRVESVRFDPLNFAVCQKDVRAEFVRKAQYIHRVIRAMLESIPK